jgi:hypothetical protein
MKAKQLFIALLRLIILVSKSGCKSADELPPINIPEVTLEGTAWTLQAFIKDHADLIIVRHGERYGIEWFEWLNIFNQLASDINGEIVSQS